MYKPELLKKEKPWCGMTYADALMQCSNARINALRSRLQAYLDNPNRYGTILDEFRTIGNMTHASTVIADVEFNVFGDAQLTA